MQLIVGENSYMTLEQANQLVNDNYTSTDPEKEYWDSLSNNDKSVLIYRTTRELERPCFIWRGVRQDIHQNMQWPRIINKVVYDAPTQILLGILANIFNNNNIQQSEETRLKDTGVKTFKDGTGAMIEFFDNAKTNRYITKLTDTDIYAFIYDQYFSDWTTTVN